MLLLAASLAVRAPVSLGDVIAGTGERNAGFLVKPALRASGRRQFR